MNEGAGDWICSDQSCGNINFARRLSCYRCNKDRPDGGKMSKKKLGTEIGKSAAEKSRGLFNADDWQCNKCANVNWARRTTCNVCNAPKFGEVEARTGYGGGYNERGVVEYRRREPSSDDEYDEFGRKKRKRKPEASNAVGITEGPLVKKLPPTLLQMKINMEAKEDPAPNGSLLNNKDSDNMKGSLSDSSVCDLPPLSKMAFRRHQLHHQTNYHRQDQMLPSYKTNGPYSRKRFTSSTDQDLRDSLVNVSTPKKPKHLPGKYSSLRCFNQNTENRLQSSKDDVVYKFTGATPTESYEVAYSVEERVKVAAFAIVHNNCKISTEKFEALYDKPAPDFKTIFAWRQRLLSTGCLIDTHISSTCLNKNKISPTKPLTNPDEIHISSDSETECTKINNVKNNTKAPSLLRSTSAETLLICNSQKVSGSSGSIAEEQTSQVREHLSPCQRARSSSHDTQESNYPDSDLEKKGSHISKSRINVPEQKQSINVNDSESDTEISYDSDYVDFLSRVYGEGKKPILKRNKREASTDIKINCEPNREPQTIRGYCTVKKSEQTPLATGNIYTSNVHNMHVKSNHNLIDADGCSAEYVPTKLGLSTKKNYQDFKNNVKKKGFWAKGNCSTIQKNKHTSIDKTINDSGGADYVIKSPLLVKNPSGIPLINPTDDGNTEPFLFSSGFEQPPPPLVKLQGDDFTNDDFEQIIVTDNYTSFDKPLQSSHTIISPDNSCIFDVVQSNSAMKNKSIMEIFDVFDDHVSPETNTLDNNISDKPNSIVWDEDDDALYKDADDAAEPNSNKPDHSLPDFDLITQSLIGKLQPEFIRENKKLAIHVDMDNQTQDLTESNQNKTGSGIEMTAKFSHTPISSHVQEEDILSQVVQPHSSNGNMLHINEPHNEMVTQSQTELPEKGNYYENVHQSPSQTKKIHVIESITITPQGYNNTEIVSTQNSVEHSMLTTTMANNKSTMQKFPKESINMDETAKTHVDLSNILAGINTDTLLLALQNLQQLAPKPDETNHLSKQIGQDNNNDTEINTAPVETINLTNDEDWEKESDREGSIEKQLKKLHGNTGETPFLSDIFDPGPVIIPPNVAKKLNINLEQNGDALLPETNENASVIGNFKSFALPKPIMLNRLKLAIKQPDKNSKQSSDGRKRKRKKKSKSSAEQGEELAAAQGEGEGEAEAEGGDEEESGDDADLSKYDLWGSDEDNGHSSKTETTGKPKDGEPKEGGSDEADKNGTAASLESKTTKRRSRSSSSSSSSTSSSSSSRSSADAPKNKFDDFNLNSERESPPGSPRPGARRPRSRSRSRSRSPVLRAAALSRRKRDSRSAGAGAAAGDSRSHEASREKDKSRSRERERERRERRASRDRSRPERADRKERRYSRDGAPNHFGARGRHR